jgi:hypothetical protein
MIARLERVTYGDDYARVPGLLNQVEGLRGDGRSTSTGSSTWLACRRTRNRLCHAP